MHMTGEDEIKIGEFFLSFVVLKMNGGMNESNFGFVLRELGGKVAVCV